MHKLELNKIHNIDCLEFMKTLPDKCIDLVLTDPPYGINVGRPRERERELKSASGQFHSEVEVGIQGVSRPKVIWGLMTLESQVKKCLRK